MLGWMFLSFEAFVAEHYGSSVWTSIRTTAALSEECEADISDASWQSFENYPDQLMISLVSAAAARTEKTITSLLEDFGRYFISYAKNKGYEELFRCQGNNLRDWLRNINEIHVHLHFSVGKDGMSSFPEFFCEEDELSGKGGESLILHYKSQRGSFFAPMVVGIIKEAASELFGLNISFESLQSQQRRIARTTSSEDAGDGNNEDSEETSPKFSASWRLRGGIASVTDTSPILTPARGMVNHKDEEHQREMFSKAISNCPFAAMYSNNNTSSSSPGKKTPIANNSNCNSNNGDTFNINGDDNDDGGMNGDMLKKVFPFHFIVDRHLNIRHVGEKMKFVVPDVKKGDPVQKWFTMVSPMGCGWDWKAFRRSADSTFEIDIAAGPCSGVEGGTKPLRLTGGLYMSEPNKKWKMKGMLKRSSPTAIFLVQPDVETLDDMRIYKLTWSDFPKHSAQKKLVYFAEHLKSETVIGQKSRVEAINAQQLLDMKRTFVRYVSHEIRTPLNTVSMGLKLIQDIKNKKFPGDVAGGNEDNEGEEDLFEMTDEIKESCDIAINILNDLLLYEKMEGGLLELDKKPEPGLSLVYEAVKLFAIQAHEASVDFDCTYDADAFADDELDNPTVFLNVDKVKLSQVLRNLVANAIQCNTEGFASKLQGEKDPMKPTKKVTVHSSIHLLSVSNLAASKLSVAKDLQSEDDRSTASSVAWSTGESQLRILRVEVEDSEATITSDMQSKIFDKVISFDPNSLQGGGQGSGLGMFISKGIMDLHGGTIGVTVSEEGVKGATFYIEIPLCVDRKPSAADSMALDELATTNSNHASTSNQALVPVSIMRKGSFMYDPGHTPHQGIFMSRMDGSSPVQRRALVNLAIDGIGSDVTSPIRSTCSRDSSVPSFRGLQSAESVASLSTIYSNAHAWKMLGKDVLRKERKGGDGSSTCSSLMATRRNSFVVGVSSVAGQSDGVFSAPVSPAAAAVVMVSPHVAVAPFAAPAVVLPVVVVRPRISTIPMKRETSKRASVNPSPIPAQLSVGRTGSGSGSASATPLAVNGDTFTVYQGEKKLNLLVVDDSIGTRKMISRCLKLKKFCDNPLEAGDGAEAVEMVKSTLENAPSMDSDTPKPRRAPFDAILMDFVMPVMDGPTATRLIREEGFSGLIIGVTGNVLPEDKEFFIGKGADAVLTKPLDVAQLAAALSKLQGKPEVEEPKKVPAAPVNGCKLIPVRSSDRLPLKSSSISRRSHSHSHSQPSSSSGCSQIGMLVEQESVSMLSSISTIGSARSLTKIPEGRPLDSHLPVKALMMDSTSQNQSKIGTPRAGSTSVTPDRVISGLFKFGQAVKSGVNSGNASMANSAHSSAKSSPFARFMGRSTSADSRSVNRRVSGGAVGKKASTAANKRQQYPLLSDTHGSVDPAKTATGALHDDYPVKNNSSSSGQRGSQHDSAGGSMIQRVVGGVILNRQTAGNRGNMKDVSAVENSSRFTDAGDVPSNAPMGLEDELQFLARLVPGAGSFRPGLPVIEEMIMTNNNNNHWQEERKKKEERSGTMVKFSLLNFLSRLTACRSVGRVKPWVSSRLQSPHNEFAAVGLRDRPPSNTRVHPGAAVEPSGLTSTRPQQQRSSEVGIQPVVPHDTPTAVPLPGTHSGTSASPAPVLGGNGTTMGMGLGWVMALSP